MELMREGCADADSDPRLRRLKLAAIVREHIDVADIRRALDARKVMP